MNVRADQIKIALAKKHEDDFFLTEVKNGPTQSVRNHFKMDAMAFKKSWANPVIIGYEVKVARSDFQRDDKWPAYLPMCNQFSFVCPTGLIQPDELPAEVGLIWYNPEKVSLTTKRKAIYRLIDEPVDMYKYIIMSKLDSDRHPFFSSKREFFEAWVADRPTRYSLASLVSEKLQQEMRQLRDAADKDRYKNDRNEADANLLQEVADVLKERGISVHRWGGWQDELRAALSGSVPPNVLWTLSRLTGVAEELRRMLEPKIENREEQS